jgi:hypothetical protein
VPFHWTIPCSGCQAGVTIDERALGPHGLICPHCQGAIDASQGAWQPHHPESLWGEGFAISHPMVPWMTDRYEEILEKQRTYDPIRFRNEVLGLPTSLGDHVVTQTEMEACCGTERMLNSDQDAGLGRRVRLFAGIDWGGGVRSRTLVVIVSMRPDNVCQVHQILALQAREEPNRVVEEVARCCRQHQVTAVAADGNGNGHVYNHLLYGKFQPEHGFYAIYYSSAEQSPVPDGVRWRWTINRSASISHLFSRVKIGKMLFPCRDDMAPYVAEFTCELAEYDEIQRAIKYTHPESQRDDALHATNYALSLATRAFNAPQS